VAFRRDADYRGGADEPGGDVRIVEERRALSAANRFDLPFQSLLRRGIKRFRIHAEASMYV